MKRKKKLLSYILVMAMIISLFNGGNTLAYSYEVPVNEKEVLSTMSLKDGKQTEGKEFKQTEVETELIQQTEAETEPAQQTEAETEPAQQTEAETEPIQQAEAETEPVQQTEAETEPVQQTEAETEPVQQTEAETEPAQQTEAETEPAQQTEAETEPVQQTEAETEPIQQTEAETEPIPKNERTGITSKIYFRTGGDGKVVVDGQEKIDCLYKDVLEGDEVPVPGVKANDGYQFKCWKKGSASGEVVELGSTVVGTTEDQTYYAMFEPKNITITFRVKNQEGATITASGSNGTVKYEQIDDYTVKATYKYYKNARLRYPTFKAEAGYTSEILSTSNTYWWDETNGSRGVGSTTISPIPTEDREYSLIMGPLGNRQTKVLYKAKDGSDIYTSTGKVVLNTPSDVLIDYTIDKLEEKGYIVPEEMKGYQIVYDRANYVIMTDGKGQTVQEGVLNGNYFTFTLELPKAYQIETSANEFVTIDAGGKGEEGKDYTVNFTVQEGYAVSCITVDGKDLSKEEIKALNGSYTFKALDADHTIRVEAEKAYKIYFRTGGDGKIVVDGQEKVDRLYKNVLEGDEVSVPEVKANDGYQFKCWKKGSASGEVVELGTTVVGTTEDQTYYAMFEPKNITITFRVKNQEGATITAPGSNSTVKYEQIDDYTVKATYKYYKNARLRYPTFKAEAGYTSEILSTSNTYWWDETNGSRGVGSTNISPIPTADREYSLIM